MHKEEVMKIETGRKLDFLIARRVMGEKFHSFVTDAAAEISLKNDGEIPHYSTNVYSAEKVLEKIKEKSTVLLLGISSWECKVFLPTGPVVSSGLSESIPLAVCRAALLTDIEEENQKKSKQFGNKQKLKMLIMRRFSYAKKDKKYSKLIILTRPFFIAGLVLLALWNLFLGGEIKRTGMEREKLKNDMRKIEILEKADKDHIKDVLKQKAIAHCFRELIIDYKEKYSSIEKQDCVQIVAIIDEKYGNKGLDAPLILAWLEKESDGNPAAVSRAGAKGLTQLMDFRAVEVLTAMGYTSYDKELVFNPVINLESGLNHLITLMNYWHGQGITSHPLILIYALHSYKWGSENTEELFNTEKRAYRPAIEYVNWILNRREYWVKRLEYWVDNPQKLGDEIEKKGERYLFLEKGDNLFFIGGQSSQKKVAVTFFPAEHN